MSRSSQPIIAEEESEPLAAVEDEDEDADTPEDVPKIDAHVDGDTDPVIVIYLVQTFKAGKGTRLVADTPIRCRSSDAARMRAGASQQRRPALLHSPTRVTDLGEYDEKPTIIFRAVRLPPPIDEA